MANGELTAKQRRFVAEYVKDCNASQAAIRAGYAAKHADVDGPRLLGNAGIKTAIAALQAKQLMQADLSAKRTLEELRRLAFSDVRKLFDAKGNLLPIQSLPDDVASTVASVEVIHRNLTSGDGAVDTIHKIKVWDKPRSLELLAKHFSLLVEQINVNVTVDLAERIKAGRQKLLEWKHGNGDSAHA